MYLKRIELFGFKTFADNTVIEFHPQNKITAIVGPNGCGKSNVFDAVRWILGEQSLTMLRSSTTEEIIFSGTEKRKPISLASASITIDNSDGYLPLDYNEITIKRKVYRSGESEYFINKQPCRLKDIINLFLDTGIGRDSYFMVGQGQIESILSSKPEDRKAIFEEAAGINKYKTRKKAAEKKLKNVEQNLIRLNDLRVELRNRLEPLAIQAKKAEEYIDLKNKLKEIEIGFYKERVDRLLKQKQKLKEDINTWLSELNTNEKQKHTLFQSKADIEEERKTIDVDLDKLKEELNNIKVQKESIQGEKKIAELNLKNCHEKFISIESDILKIRQEEGDVGKQKEELEGKLEAAIIAEEKEREKLAVLEEEELTTLNLWKEATDKLESIKENLFLLETDIVKARNEIMSIDHHKNMVLKEQEKTEKEIEKLTEKKEEQIKLKNKLEETKEYLIVNKNDTYRGISDYERLINEAEKNLNDLESKRIQIKEKYDKQSSRLYLLREMIKGYEGYGDGVKSILIDKSEDTLEFGKDIQGVVADMFEVEKAYETAVETALGARIQNIVTSNNESAYKAVNYLKSKNLGRAAFLCSEILEGKSDEIDLGHLKKDYSGVYGLASNCIKTDYKNIFQYLLGKTLVVDSLDTAVRVCNLKDVKHNQLSIVTLEGDIIYTEGEIAGGSAPKGQSTLLNRQKQIIDLEKETEKYKGEGGQIDLEISNIKLEKQDLLKAYDEFRENNRRYEVELKALEEEYARKNDILTDIQDEINLLEENILTQNKELDFLNSKKEEMANRQLELEDEKKNKSKEADNLEKRKIELNSLKEDIQGRITGQKIIFTEKLSEKKQWQNHIDILSESIDKYTANLKEKEKEKESLQSFEREMKSRLQEIEELIPKIFDDEKKKEEGLKEKIIFKNVAEVKTKELEKEHEKLILSHDEVKEKLTAEEIKLARIEADFESIEKILEEEHQATIEEVLNVETKIEDAKEAYKEASQYKKRIRELEPVNVLAVDEYKATNERFTFVDKQCLDLLEAKENLEKLIRQLDTLAKSSFVGTIKNIRKHFLEIFERLFSGGKADLIISDESNILESSIEIFAQPPGKKLINLNLLSGGEKALTGVALIFALMKIKPSPFCFLDEVDAPLDESNIERFVDLVSEFTRSTQMILITHNKKTMHSANSLYGVTMEEMGISKLISMKLVEEEKLVKETK